MKIYSKRGIDIGVKKLLTCPLCGSSCEIFQHSTTKYEVEGGGWIYAIIHPTRFGMSEFKINCKSCHFNSERHLGIVYGTDRELSVPRFYPFCSQCGEMINDRMDRAFAAIEEGGDVDCFCNDECFEEFKRDNEDSEEETE